jgi:tetratricopeptide (TPR) repeat protein
VHRSGLISLFGRPSDNEEMNDIVARAIDSADIVLVLVSPSFLASYACMALDLRRIMARSAAGRAHVVPILARACGLTETPFADVQMRPVDGGLIASRADREAAWRDVVREVACLVGSLQARRVVREHGFGIGRASALRRKQLHAPDVETPLERPGPASNALELVLDRCSPRARWLLMSAAVFAPAAVPLEWVVPPPEPTAEDRAATSALGELERMRLVVVNEGAGALTMHPSLRACIKRLASPEAWEQVASWAVGMVERWLARAGSELVEARLPHLREVFALAQEMDDELAATALYERFADHFRTRSAAPGTHAWYESEIAVAEKAFGPEHPKVASLLADVAQVAARAGAVEGARALMERSITLTEKLHGRDHLEVANRLAMLAQMLEETGQPEMALPFMQRVVHINLKALGRKHADVAGWLFSLATLWRTLGRPDQALIPMQRAIDVLEQARAPGHPCLDIPFLRKKLAELREELDGSSEPPGAPPAA